MSIPKVLYSNPSFYTTPSYQLTGGGFVNSPVQYAATNDSSSQLDSTLQSRKPQQQVGFWDALKKVFFNGFLEKAMAGLLIYECYGKIQGGLKLPNSNALKLGITLFGALGIGELFIKFEEAAENWANNLFNPQDNKSSQNRHPADWTWTSLFAKTLSISVLTAAGIAKKMWLFSEASSEHESEIAKVSKEALHHSISGFAGSFGLTYSEEEKTKISNSNLLNSFHEAGEWFHKQAGTHTNPFAKAFSHANGFLIQRVVGCPSLRGGGKPTLGAIAGDAAVKMAVLVPIGLTIKFLLDQSHKLFSKKKDQDSDDYNTKESY